MLTFRQIGLGAALTTAALAIATRSRRVQRWDDALERAAARRRPRLDRAAAMATLPGEQFVHPSIGAAIALTILALRGGEPRRILIPLAVASLGAIAAHYSVKLFYGRRRPALALERGQTEPAYPSGHTADATAVLLTAAYLLVREDVIPAAVALPIAAALALGTGVSRVILGWHWGSDVVGGWLAGIAVAAGGARIYEGLR
jgi:undecaprenyl-diphosphatase